MNLKFKVFIPLLMGLMLATGMIIGVKVNPGSKQFKYDEFHKLKEVLAHIHNAYIDTVNTNELIETAIQDIMFGLDPHCVYISAKELQEMNESLQGDFEGIGIEFNILSDTIIVVSAISGGPSEALGIRAGDKIIKIDNENVAGIGITNNDVLKKLRGEKGTKVKVSIYRKQEPEILDFEIVRDKIPIYSVDASYMINDRIGYIKLNRFSGKTAKEVNEAIIRLRAEGLEDLILDLRGNPGGYLKAASELSDQFFDSKKLIVYTKGRTSRYEEYYSTGKGEFMRGNLIVLINEGSASASEIVAGAIQDYDRGLIIGRRSFGKGLVQDQIMLSDGSAIRLTIAQYYTPSGRCIQKPYKNGSHADYYLDLMNRYEHGEMTNKDSIEFPDSLKYKTSSNRTVYGGGGIMPDIFIPLDTTMDYSFINHVNRTGLLYQYVLRYVDRTRGKDESRYKEFSTFDKSFNVTNKMLSDFCALAKENDVTRNTAESEMENEMIKTYMKAFIARQYFGSNGYFRVINRLDNEYIKAIEIFETKKLAELGIKSTTE